jgi:hypothetical protein
MQAAVERITFAGFEACVGPCVLGLFWLPGCLGVIGLIALAATGEIATSAEVWQGLAIGVRTRRSPAFGGT